ncbi:hypothetical protein CDL15_Pgr015273 [Punica granatum]|uniref:TRF2/HOY1 PH-like domain-containing protein n=1 Tax=Punica granatum TaxID=22663 RepID=A0A218W055_PUNGR|nr:hypothetical protein CDL15_Pgr015273 [Punica granatum]
MTPGSGSLPEPETEAGAAARGNVPVKLESFEEDSLEEEHGPLSKRARACIAREQQWGAGANAFPISPSEYNPLDEPSPLGLRLKKSPSLLDLIQMRLSQGSPALEVVKCEDHGKGVEKDCQSSAVSAVAADKMKASNFSGSVLKIGQWEYTSRYEGDLVAKCYFAKRKLVWEILEGGLKSKIEIQWSDIMALRAEFPDNGPGQLNVVLGKQPLFFRETNPQPRKHTLWQATSDFTDGQASTHRQHLLECPPDLLEKNFDKLIQYDARLNHLSQRGVTVLDAPLFEAKAPVSGDLEPPKSFSKAGNGKDSAISSIKESNSVRPSSLRVELLDPTGAAPECRFRDCLSPSSDVQVTEENRGSEAIDTANTTTQEHITLPGLRKSMSVSDFVNHIGQRIAENMDSGERETDGGGKVTGLTDATDSSVDSGSTVTEVKGPKGDPNDVSSSCKQQVGMSRKDSFGDLLLHLPRVASLPKFLFDISEDDP